MTWVAFLPLLIQLPIGWLQYKWYQELKRTEAYLRAIQDK